MRRRDFITGLGSGAAWPLARRAQQPVLPVIGFLHSESAESRHEQVAAVRGCLAESGYTEGRNATVE
jgi:putative ABC transport system substrate-binding protein